MISSNINFNMFKQTIRNLALIIAIYPVIFLSLIDSLAINNEAVKSNSIPQVTQPPSNVHEYKAIDTRRPIWNMAHMVNSIKELDYRLGKGANAVEADVTFGRDGDPLYTYHGPPCDCWRHCYQREDFDTYLKYVREITSEDNAGVGKNLTLILLDLKLDYLDHKGKAHAGVELARLIKDNLFSDDLQSTKEVNQNGTIDSGNNRKLKLILSVNHVTDAELIYNFLHYFDQHNSSHLMEQIGFDVGMNDDIQQIETMWKKFGNTLNVWQGDGFTNCFSPFYNLERLSKAILKRDQESGYPKKVYQWTIDLHDRMREALTMGVDAVMTNHPERMLTILQEPEMAHNYRLASLDDSPFKKIILRPSSRNSELARHQRSTSPVNGGFFASVIDVVSSWIAYMREIPFLSFPTTTRFMPQVKRQKQISRTTSTTAKLEYRSENVTDESIALNSTQNPISNELEQTQVGDNQKPYEGPKWYTSLISNVLVTVMKLVLPAET